MVQVRSLRDLPQPSDDGQRPPPPQQPLPPALLNPVETLSGFYNACPLATRTLLVVGCVGLVLSISSSVASMLAICPNRFNAFSVYRLFTSWLVDTSALSFAFALCSFSSSSVTLEGKRGSVFLFLVFFVSCFVSGALASMLAVLLQVPTGCMGGYWPAVFSIMIIDAEDAPDAPRRVFCFPAEIPARWYPWLLALIFQLLFARGIALNIIAGLVIGTARKF